MDHLQMQASRDKSLILKCRHRSRSHRSHGLARDCDFFSQKIGNAQSKKETFNHFIFRSDCCVECMFHLILIQKKPVKEDASSPRVPSMSKDAQKRFYSGSDGSRPRSHSSPLLSTISHDASSRSFDRFVCNLCQKRYRHINCLNKHKWEHSAFWNDCAQVSKHQQVQMLEAASILVHFLCD